MLTQEPQPIEDRTGALRPIFILSCGRSGSTLLRYIVDTHPDIACPGELILGELCVALYHSVYYSLGQLLESDETERRRNVAEKVRQIVSALMDEYKTAKGKSCWCDKTPGNLQNLKILYEVFPDARYICLHRNCMDVVHSCLEIARTGFAPDMIPFVRKNLENLTAALVDYWSDNASKLLAFERENPDKCFRITYESLVVDPVATLGPMFEFLGLRFDPHLLDSVFRVRHDAGPGDNRILFSKEISKLSLGKGSAVPRAKIPSELLEQMNALLSELEYPEVGPDWNNVPSPYLPRETPTVQGEAVAAIEEIFDSHFVEVLQGQRERATEISGVCKVSIDGEGGGHWIINLAEQSIRKDRDEIETDCVVAISANDLIDMIHGRLNALSAFDLGKIRVAGDTNLASQVGQLLFGT